MAKLATGGSLSTTDSTVEMGTANAAQVGVNVTGTWTGTITFEARRGGTWENAVVFTVANPPVAAAATTTANVSRRIDTGGTNAVRARFSTASSGAPVVQFDGTEAGMGAVTGSGGGAVTVADGADVAEGTTTDAAVVTNTTGTVIGFLRGIVTTLITAVKAHGPVVTNGSVVGVNPVLGGFAGTGSSIRQWTASNSVTATAGNDVPGIGPLVYDTANVLWNRQRDTNSADNSSGTGVAGAGLLAWDGSVYRRVSVNSSGQIILSSAKTEDLGHTTGDVGNFVLAVRQDAQSALAGTTADYIPFTTDANGSLRGVSGGYTTVLSTTLTRPNDTTAYQAGDEMTDTGTTIRTITGAARFSGGSGIIQGIYVSQQTLWTTKPAMEIWIYDTTSTPVADNGAFAPTDAVTDTAIAVIPVTATYAGTINQALDSGQISVPFLTVGSANLFFRIVIRNAAQDSAVSGVSTFRFRILQD